MSTLDVIVRWLVVKLRGLRACRRTRQRARARARARLWSDPRTVAWLRDIAL